jgi:hypothetical protein
LFNYFLVQIWSIKFGRIYYCALRFATALLWTASTMHRPTLATMRQGTSAKKRSRTISTIGHLSRQALMAVRMHAQKCETIQTLMQTTDANKCNETNATKQMQRIDANPLRDGIFIVTPRLEHPECSGRIEPRPGSRKCPAASGRATTDTK